VQNMDLKIEIHRNCAPSRWQRQAEGYSFRALVGSGDG
jgi:hypothetical protein